jgi:hypothetical protein
MATTGHRRCVEPGTMDSKNLRHVPPGCGVRALVVDGVAVKIKGHPADPDKLGKLCPKGNIRSKSAFARS